MILSFQRTRILLYNSPASAILPLPECKYTSSEVIGKQDEFSCNAGWPSYKSGGTTEESWQLLARYSGDIIPNL